MGRFLDTGASTAMLNMAIDQAILEIYANGGYRPTLRVYQWNPPAISLGYLQKRHGIDIKACRSLGINVVRRPTGGRAVLHFGDLTYSVVAGTTDGIPSSVAGAYQLICKGLLAAFRILGFEANICRSVRKSSRSDVCFLTSTTGDIHYQGKKFVGSAQTWQGSSVLQHGSIILEPNFKLWAKVQVERHELSKNYEKMLKQGMTSVSEILGYLPTYNELAGAIRQGMTQVLGIEFSKGNLNHEEMGLVNKIVYQYVKEHPVDKLTSDVILQYQLNRRLKWISGSGTGMYQMSSVGADNKGGGKRTGDRCQYRRDQEHKKDNEIPNPDYTRAGDG